MNDPDWVNVLMLIGTVGLHLLVIATGILVFRRRMPRRIPLLIGALIFGLTGIFWDVVTRIIPLYSKELSQEIFSMLFTSYWENITWVSAAGSLLYQVALLLIAMDRSNQARRIAELEAILRDREELMKSR